ncbi:SCO family protein [Luteimonas sp. e5]
MFNRTTLIILVAAMAVAGLLAGLAVFNRAPAPAPDSVADSAVPLEAFKRFDQPREIPPVNLVRSDGQPLTTDSLEGHWTLVFIGFVHCPDICPTTLAQMKRAQNLWADLPEATRPRLLFVSVDPERDTPELVGRYANGFHADTIAATGELPALRTFARSLSLVFMKQPPERGAPEDRYAVDHSASIAVLDPQVRMAGVITPDPATGGFEPERIAAEFTALTQAAQ